MVTRHLPPSYSVARESLHRLAEHVVSPALYAATGKIGLRRSPGGFATPPFGDTERVVAVEGDHIVVTDHSDSATARRARITTIAEAARFVGVAPGAPSEVYRPSTPFEPDAAVSVDVEAAEVVSMWFELTDMALGSFATSIADDLPTVAQLWPEHFDLAMTADRINYGGSPGDEYIDVPYLYVGPYEGRPSEASTFWNQPFGAAIGFDEIESIHDAFEFFRRGRQLTNEAR